MRAAGRTVPRLVVAGVQSGVGKTTFACAILAALRRRGLRAVSFKAGPDYLDPTYLTRAAGLPCRNLDTWMLPPHAVLELFGRAVARGGAGWGPDGPAARARGPGEARPAGSATAAMAIVEGVMGLYDGRGGGPAGSGEDEGSTAHLAKLLDAPVVLVADAAASSRTVAAVVLGCQRFDPAVRLAGVLLSGIAGERHLDLVAGPIGRATGLPVLGYLPPRREFALPERHLGLVPAGEQGVDAAFFDRLAAQAEATLDLERLRAIAHAAPALPALPAPAHLAPLFPERAAARPAVRIALALDDAFHFYYEDGLDLLRAHGAELVPFSPLADAALPEGTQGVYLGGGFPEVFAARLAANRALLAALRRAAAGGVPIYGECGGLMYLGEGIVDAQGRRHALAGLVPCWSEMSQPQVTLGYRVATARRASLLLAPGQVVRGHEFHWSTLDHPPPPDSAAYDLASASGRAIGREGFVAGPRRNVLASYLHLHFGADPGLPRPGGASRARPYASTLVGPGALAPAFVAACRSQGSIS